MSNAKVVSVLSHEVTRSRRAIEQNFVKLAEDLAAELVKINQQIDVLHAAVADLRRKPPPAVDPRLAQDKRSDIVDASYREGVLPRLSD